MIRTNRHRAAVSYIQEALELKVLQILYPNHHYTKENYTEFRIIPEKNLSDFRQYGELAGMGDDYPLENATFFTLARNQELYSLLQSIEYVESRFNWRYHYPWVFANDEEFDENFKLEVSHLVSGEATFVTIPKEMWSYPPHIDQKKALETRERMEKHGIIYGGSESYRFMCRFNSGFFYKLDALAKYKYYWRVEPDIKFNCDLDFDYFKHMRENKLKYGFTMTLHELPATVDGLFSETKKFFRDLHPEYINENNQIEFISQDNEESFNMCHYWSNFELGDLDWLRSKEYNDYFNHLEESGGFFYERWGDAPVHTLAVSYMLDQKEVFYFDNTGYYHVPNSQCPRDGEKRIELRCTCELSKDFNWGSFESCLPYWYETRDEPRPWWAPQTRVYNTHRPIHRRRFHDKRDEIVDDQVELLDHQIELSDIDDHEDLHEEEEVVAVRTAFLL